MKDNNGEAGENDSDWDGMYMRNENKANGIDSDDEDDGMDNNGSKDESEDESGRKDISGENGLGGSDDEGGNGDEVSGGSDDEGRNRDEGLGGSDDEGYSDKQVGMKRKATRNIEPATTTRAKRSKTDRSGGHQVINQLTKKALPKRNSKK